MITDKNLFIGSGATNTSYALNGLGTGTTYLNSIDLTNLRDIGEGNDLYMVFSFPVALIGASGLTTIEFGAIAAAADGGGDAITIGTTGTFTLGTSPTASPFKAGSFTSVKLSGLPVATPAVGGSIYRRYLTARVVIAGASMGATSGMVVNVDIVTDMQQALNRYYASGFSVSNSMA